MDVEALRRKRQLNVQEQNALLADAVASLTRRARAGEFSWLQQCVGVAELTSGVLAQLSNVPEDTGDWFAGLWLARSERFFEFEVVLPWGRPEEIVVERWHDVTASTDVSEHLRGRGKSLGRIALELLRGGAVV